MEKYYFKADALFDFSEAAKECYSKKNMDEDTDLAPE